MNIHSAPARVRAKVSWLLGQTSTVAQQVVGGRLAAMGAHRYHYSLLAALDEFGPASQAELGRRTGLDRSDVAAAVADLAKRRLLEREPDPDDLRRNVVEIAAAGREHLAALDQLLASAHHELLASLSAAERTQLAELLTRIIDHHTPKV